MARKTNRACTVENDIFAARLRAAMKLRNFNQTGLSIKVEKEQGYIMQRQTISQYINGLSKPDTERLTVLCKALDVSADYLLGLSDTPTADKDIQFICDRTGLNQSFVERFTLFSNDLGAAHLLRVLNLFLCSSCLEDLLISLYSLQSAYISAQSFSAEYAERIDEHLQTTNIKLCKLSQKLKGLEKEFLFNKFTISEKFSDLIDNIFPDAQIRVASKKANKFIALNFDDFFDELRKHEEDKFYNGVNFDAD